MYFSYATTDREVSGTTKMKITTVTLVASLLLGLAVTQIQAAEPATDLICDKCVNQKDIAFSSIGTGRLRSGSVTESRLADESVGPSKVQDGAIERSALTAFDHADREQQAGLARHLAETLRRRAGHCNGLLPVTLPLSPNLQG